MTARPSTVPVDVGPAGPIRGLVRLLAGVAGLAGAASLLWWCGSAIPGPGSFDQRGLVDWIRTSDPVVVAFAAVRLAGLALAAWIAVTGAAATVVHGTRLRRRRWLRRLVDRACFPVVRRLVHGATGTLLVAATLLPGTGAGAAVRDAAPPVAVTAPALPAAGEVAQLRAVPDDPQAAVRTADDLDPGPAPDGPPPTTAPGTVAGAPDVEAPDVALLRPLADPAPTPPTRAGNPMASDPGAVATTPPTTAPRPTGTPVVDEAPAPSAPAGPPTATVPPSTSGLSGRPPSTRAPSSGGPSSGGPSSAERVETAVLRSLDPAPVPVPAPANAAPSTPAAPPTAFPAPAPAPEPAAARTWTVAPGDHLWHVADATLAAELGAPADVATIARYLDALITANRDRLVLPDDPDLVFAGQVLVLPDTAAARA